MLENIMVPSSTGDGLAGRQIWSTPTTHGRPPHCTAFNLPANGILVLNSTVTIKLHNNAVYQPFCTDEAIIGLNGTVPITDFQDPFVSSTIPQVFVIGAMLEIAWTLVIILIITPRTSFLSSGYGDFMGTTRGPSSVIGRGGRPLLQKVAALTVFISLLIAAVNSFRVAYDQYSAGYEDASALTDDVVGSLEIRIIRVISDTFLWLAQVQTLIRLFPRHREKVIIKWTGFALILLDTIFSILDNFVVSTNGRYIHKPQNFNNAVSALWYLFQLALSVIYMSSVLYYSIVKRRFAYFHHKMRNIFVVAVLSLISVAIPVVFFVVDIANINVIGWGDYVRWVGAAAASVVVWEWVERIEALEREERKDGILGREIFEGDELAPSRAWPGPTWLKRRRPKGPFHDGGSGGERRSGFSSGSSTVASPSRVRPTWRERLGGAKWSAPRSNRPQQAGPARTAQEGGARSRAAGRPSAVEILSPVASPVSRSDNTSAASTVYAVIHHPIHEPIAPPNDPAIVPINPSEVQQNREVNETTSTSPQQSTTQTSHRSTPSKTGSQPPTPENATPSLAADRPLRSRLARPFRRFETMGSPSSLSVISNQSLPPLPLSSTSNLAGHNHSRRRFRIRRGAPDAAVDLPLYVIRGGGNNGGELRIEPQTRRSPVQAVSYVADSTCGSPTPADTGTPRPSPSDESGPSTHTRSIESTLSSGMTRPPDSQTRHVDENPPPFTAASRVSPPPSGYDTSLFSAQQPISHADVHGQRTNASNSRASRRSPLSMPPLVEGEPDGGLDEPPSPAYAAERPLEPGAHGESASDPGVDRVAEG